MQQLADGGIGQCRVYDDEVLGCKAAGIGAVMLGCHPEKSDLEAERFFVGRFQPAGHVPPFVPEGGVGAKIPGEGEGYARNHWRKLRRGSGNASYGEMSKQEKCNKEIDKEKERRDRQPYESRSFALLPVKIAPEITLKITPGGRVAF